jgi:broad specificity phosphatase PhoE
VAYWERADPDYIHGAGAESFRQFIGRVQGFRNRLIDLPSGHVLVVGHGQFFRAFAFCLSQGFYATPQHMHDYRVAETADPMSNGEVMVFDGAAISYFTDKI